MSPISAVSRRDIRREEKRGDEGGVGIGDLVLLGRGGMLLCLVLCCVVCVGGGGGGSMLCFGISLDFSSRRIFDLFSLALMGDGRGV